MLVACWLHLSVSVAFDYAALVAIRGPFLFSRAHLVASLLSGTFLLAGCPDPDSPAGHGPRSETATKWMKRAAEEYRAMDLDEATDSIAKARAGAPDDPEVGLLGARIAITKLDYKLAVKMLEGIEGSEASGLRARAYWYADDLTHTSEELTKALEDPDYKDAWAKPVRELSGRMGTGRKPFSIREGSAKLVEMRMPRDLGYALMVPCEIDGNATVALVVTGVPEVVLDSKARTNPGWVTMKFGVGERSIEVRDVPAIVQDLSEFTAGQTVPIGALIGMNLLRRLHPTIDRRADQLILRLADPPPPPMMTKIDVGYVRGGGMVMRGALRKEFELATSFWLDTGSAWTLALPDPIWKKLGVDVGALSSSAGVKHGKINDLRLGGLDLGPVEALAGVPLVEEKLKQMDVDVAGAMGVRFLSALRVTLVENGRALWVETDEDTSMVLSPASPSVSPIKPTPSVVPASSSKPTPAASSAKPMPVSSAKPPVVPAKPAPSTSAKKP